MQLRQSLGTLFLVLSTSARAATAPALPFIAGDYARAVAEAKERRLPIFVEVSAPW